ncbi:MAG: cyanophycin synthetase [Planctomycetota bacterium]|nr:cyanophycin synthetase [Planctomycetota bacterium]
MIPWQTNALRGPNRWSGRSVLELYLSPDVAFRSAPCLSRIVQPLADFLDSGRFTTTHPESIGSARSVLARLNSTAQSQATWSEVWLRVAEWMSAMSGVPVVSLEPAESLASDDDCESQWVLPMEMEEEFLSCKCFGLAHEWIEACQRGEAYPIAAKFRELFDYADDIRLGPSSRAILDAATARNIPSYRLTSGSLCQLGEGKHHRRIWTAETDATSAIAESIASDKDLTKRLLRNVGVPVPLGRMVTSPQDAWAAALEVGLPVVVKPKDANHQRGISIELTQQDEVMKAYDWAIEDGQTGHVMVEQFARGLHHRLLVVGDRMVAASRGHFETVNGDGHSSIEQLVRNLNEDPRRGEAYTDPLGVLKLDAAAKIELAKQGLTVESVPEANREVLIRRTGDLTTDCTEEVHPLTAAQAVLAAQVVGLDIAGLDVLAEDISAPLAQQRGAVVEVNAGPSLSCHVVPMFGKPRPVGDAIVEMLFPTAHPAVIPIHGLLASTYDELCKSQIQSWMQEQAAKGLTAASVFPASVFPVSVQIQDQCIDLEDCDTRARALAALGNPRVEILLVVLSPRDLLGHGLPVWRLDELRVVDGAIQSIRASGTEEVFRVLRNAMPEQMQPSWLHGL